MGKIVSMVGGCIRSFASKLITFLVGKNVQRPKKFECAEDFDYFRSDNDFVVSILDEVVEFVVKFAFVNTFQKEYPFRLGAGYLCGLIMGRESSMRKLLMRGQNIYTFDSLCHSYGECREG